MNPNQKSKSREEIKKKKSYSFQNLMLRESLKTTVPRGGSNVLEISTNYKNIQAGKILQLLMFCFDDTKKFGIYFNLR